MSNEHGTVKLTKEADLAPEFVELCRSVTAKRPRTVIDHILNHGVITNDELSEVCGYDHPPRAIGDVRENGIPLITHAVTSPKTGRKIGAYTFGDPKDVVAGRIGGRRAFSKQFKKELVARFGAQEAFTGEVLDERYLQIDHRVPYSIAGDGEELDPAEFMLIDASSQRAKSWSCENCANMKGKRSAEICRKCFWAFPETYEHIAMEQKRRVDIAWSGDAVVEHDKAVKAAKIAGQSIQEYIKALLRK